MEKSGLEVDSTCESLEAPYNRYAAGSHGQGGVMYNLFGPGSSFNLGLVDSDSGSSCDPIRADRSLTDAIESSRLLSPRSSLKRSNVHIQTEEDDHFPPTCRDSSTESGAFHQNLSVQNFVPIDTQNYDLKGSYCGVDSLLDHSSPAGEHSVPGTYLNPVDKIASSLSNQLVTDGLNIFCRNDNAPVHLDGLHSIHEESKRSQNISEAKPSLSNSFLTMENSNNAIDNNLHSGNSINHSIPATADCISGNHIFKLPNNELTFNGTLKHLQRLQPIVEANCKSLSVFKEDYKYLDSHRDDNAKEESAEDVPYKSSDEVTSNSPQSESASSSKSGITIFSSASQFPSDCEIVSQAELPSKKLRTKFSDILDGSTSAHKTDIIKVGFATKLTFEGTVSPLKGEGPRAPGGIQPRGSAHNRSGESLDSSYSSGAQSPNMFSDEDDILDSKFDINKTDFILKQFEKCDKLVMKKLEKTLQGVPPPPSVTISQLTVHEILDLYKKNLARFNSEEPKQFYDEASSSITPPRRTSCDITSDPNISVSLALALENTVSQAYSSTCPSLVDHSKPKPRYMQANFSEYFATTADWPQLQGCRYYGVHYNSTAHSEQLDCLLSRYMSRFVGCETASSCVALPLASSCRRPARPGLSPGRRLSHLARRRTAFYSAANLVDTSAAKRQILIDRKKFNGIGTGRLQVKGKSPRTRRTPGKRTPGRKTPGKKTPAKKTPAKKTPGSSQRKRGMRRLAINSEQMVKTLPTRESSKRALFLSPENAITKPLERAESAPKPSTSRAVRSKRSLFGTPIKEESNSGSNPMMQMKSDLSQQEPQSKKRERLDDSASDQPLSQRTKLQKSFSFGGDKIEEGVKSLTRRASEYIPTNGELSDIHRKKLLWAVAEALRPHGINMSHPQFKLHACALARLTRKLSHLPTHSRTLRCPSSSTSDTLLKIARLHVFSVIKGKSVDELFAEEQMKQANGASTRVSGYVPLNGYEPNRVHPPSSLSRNSENSYGDIKNIKPEATTSIKTVLQDKTVNIDSRSNGSSNGVINGELKKPVLFRDGNRLRARRQISFDNMEDPSKR